MNEYKPSIEVDSNYGNLIKIENIKKNILNQTLTYNLAVMERLRLQKNKNAERQRRQSESINYQLNKRIQQEKMQRLKRKYYMQQQLKHEYARQIQRKNYQKVKIKEYDEEYALVEKDYSKFSQQRRMRDLARMYKRPTYQGILPNYVRKIKTQFSQPSKNQYEIRQKNIYQKPFETQDDNNPNPQYHQTKKYLKVEDTENKKLQFKQPQRIQKEVEKELKIDTQKDSLTYLRDIEKKQKQQYKRQLDQQVKYRIKLKRHTPF